MKDYIHLPDGTIRYFTAEGDVLDDIAFDFYGHHEGTTELLFESNPNLSWTEQPFGIGVLITLPPFEEPPTPPQIELWD